MSSGASRACARCTRTASSRWHRSGTRTTWPAGNYFAHGNFVGRIKRARYLSGAGTWSVGENIAWGSGELATPREIVKAWMNSPPHRHNILHRKFGEVGIGVARGVPVRANYDGATYTTDFGKRG